MTINELIKELEALSPEDKEKTIKVAIRWEGWLTAEDIELVEEYGQYYISEV